MECNITEGERRHAAASGVKGRPGRRCGILIIILGREVPAKASQMRPAPVWHNDIVPTAKNLPTDSEREASREGRGEEGGETKGVKGVEGKHGRKCREGWEGARQR